MTDDMSSRSNAERRLVALPDLTVIANRGNGLRRPGRVKADRLAELTLQTQTAADLWVLALLGLFDSGRRHAQVLSLDQGEMNSFDDRKPSPVTLPHEGPERFPADDFRQQHVIILPAAER